MGKTVSEKIAHLHTYQQALDDFGVTELMSHIRNYADENFNAALMNLEEQELESLAAILIQRLINNLKGKLIASYLNAIRHGDSHVIFDPTNLEIPPPLLDLPDQFPNGVTPRYQEGDRVRWQTLSNTTDWGIVIGRFYAYARHRCQWAVCYLVRLDRNSASAAWIAADTAWEEDLEPNTDNGWEHSADEESSLGVRQTNPHAVPSPRTTPSLTPDLTQQSTPTQTSTSNRYVPPTSRHAFPSIHKSLHAPSGRYRSDGTDANNPRTQTQRERDLIELYSNCQLALTPMRFYGKWSVRYQEIASICDRSISTVERWFNRGRNYRRPTFNDLRHLAIMDFLLEHFEEIPSPLFNLLCLSNRGQRYCIK